MRQDTVKQRVKELEIQLEKAREELAESEAEKYSLATPTMSKADDDEIGIDEMIKSPGAVELPPGIGPEDAHGKDAETTGRAQPGPGWTAASEPGKSSKD